MMNNFSYKLISLLLFSVVLITSCSDDEDVWPADYNTSTVFTTNLAGAATFFDLVDVNNAAIGFTINSIGEVNINSVDIYKALNGGDKVLHSTVTSLPSDVTITAQEATDGLGITPDDLAIGDEILFTYVVKTDQGDFAGSDFFKATAKCESNLGGTYEMFSDILFADNGPQQYTETVELVDLGGGEYQFFDMTGGAWGTNYAALYGTSPRVGIIVDVCDVLSAAPVSDQFGFEIVIDPINYDPATGVISWTWNDTGYDDNGTVTLTPQ